MVVTGKKKKASCVVQLLLPNLKRSAAKIIERLFQKNIPTILSKERLGHICAGFAPNIDSVIESNTDLERDMG